MDYSDFGAQKCPYCMGELSDADMSSGKVQMFLAEGCYHQFHVACFKDYAKKTLLTKLPSGEFKECRCEKCKTLVMAEDLREAIGPEFLESIRNQQTKLAMMDSDDIVQCPGCAEVFSCSPS